MVVRKKIYNLQSQWSFPLNYSILQYPVVSMQIPNTRLDAKVFLRSSVSWGTGDLSVLFFYKREAQYERQEDLRSWLNRPRPSITKGVSVTFMKLNEVNQNSFLWRQLGDSFVNALLMVPQSDLPDGIVCGREWRTRPAYPTSLTTSLPQW